MKREDIIELLTEVANWNEDYSSTLIKIKAKKLLAQLQTKEMSDEEIEAKYPISSIHQMDTDSWNNRLRQEGAKWYREEIKQL